eukprot:1150521-Pelagomonas_calceolata.AAC.4
MEASPGKRGLDTDSVHRASKQPESKRQDSVEQGSPQAHGVQWLSWQLAHTSWSPWPVSRKGIADQVQPGQSFCLSMGQVCQAPLTKDQVTTDHGARISCITAKGLGGRSKQAAARKTSCSTHRKLDLPAHVPGLAIQWAATAQPGKQRANELIRLFTKRARVTFLT